MVGDTYGVPGCGKYTGVTTGPRVGGDGGVGNGGIGPTVGAAGVTPGLTLGVGPGGEGGKVGGLVWGAA
jgi:hypothetical protein